jgi:hypothetical protein
MVVPSAPSSAMVQAKVDHKAMQIGQSRVFSASFWLALAVEAGTFPMKIIGKRQPHLC